MLLLRRRHVTLASQLFWACHHHRRLYILRMPRNCSPEILAEVTARPAVQDAGASLEAWVMANGHPSQVAWEKQVNAHLANTERLLLEMHGVLQSALTNTRSEVSIGLHLPLRCTPSQRNNNFAICGISPRARLSGTSTVSTVSYCHKINSHSDPCNNFM